MRSKLFVPGTRPEFFAKALSGEADGICIDLEDAVTDARKDESRRTVADWLRRNAPRVTGKTLMVRVNAADTPHFAADVAAVVLPGVQVLNLPKVAEPEAVREASAAIADAQARNGVTTAVGLLLTIESPQALRQAAALAKADPRVVGLQLGLGDLFEPSGVDRTESAAIVQAMFAVRMAAGEAGLYAYDGAFANVADAAGYLAEARLARRLGFLGKTCIHPSQVALANEAFQPTAEEVEHALRVEAAAALADARGVGAYLVDGRMIDAPFLRRAQAVLASARALGLAPPGPGGQGSAAGVGSQRPTARAGSQGPTTGAPTDRDVASRREPAAQAGSPPVPSTSRARSA